MSDDQINSFAAYLLCENKREFPASAAADGFVNEICLQFGGDSARFGFYPLTSIHFGCRPLFGSRLLGEVVS